MNRYIQYIIKMTTIDLVTSGLMNFNDNKQPNMSRSVITTQVTTSPTILDYTFSATAPTPRIGHTIVFVPGTTNYLYMFGGRDSSANYYNQLWNYNLSTNKWTLLSPSGTLPTARSEHAMFYYNGLIYIYGGWNGTTYYDDLYSYNPTSGNAWTLVTTTGGATTGTHSILRYGFGYAIQGSKLYVFGGMVAGSVNHCVLILSLTTPFTWTNNAHNLPSARYRLSAVTNSAGTDIYLYGGATTTASLSGLLRFTVSTGVFTTVTTNGTNPSLCAGYALFIVNTVIYLYGGYTTTGGATNNSIFTCDTSLTTPTWTNPSTSLLSYARCLCGFASNGSTIYIDDGATSSALTTSLNETWTDTLGTYPGTQLPTKQIHVNATTFTLVGVVFTVFKDTANSNHAALRWTVPLGVATGLIISLSSLRIVA